ncbi:precorrin methylase, partial [Sphingomonas sp. Ant20]
MIVAGFGFNTAADAAALRAALAAAQQGLPRP